MYQKKPYKIEIEGLESFPDSAIGVYEKEKNANRFIFLNGKPIQETISELYFKIERPAKRGLEMDFWPNNSGTLLAGPRASQFLQEFCPADVQLFDAHIRCKDQEVTSYKLVNLSHTVNSIDEEKSQCTYFKEGGLRWVEKLVFKENCMNNHHIARDGRYDVWIVCSPEFVKEYKKRKLKGLKFVEDDAYRLGQESFA